MEFELFENNSLRPSDVYKHQWTKPIIDACNGLSPVLYLVII